MTSANSRLKPTTPVNLFSKINLAKRAAGRQYAPLGLFLGYDAAIEEMAVRLKAKTLPVDVYASYDILGASLSAGKFCFRLLNLLVLEDNHFQPLTHTLPPVAVLINDGSCTTEELCQRYEGLRFYDHLIMVDTSQRIDDAEGLTSLLEGKIEEALYLGARERAEAKRWNLIVEEVKKDVSQYRSLLNLQLKLANQKSDIFKFSRPSASKTNPLKEISDFYSGKKTAFTEKWSDKISKTYDGGHGTVMQSVRREVEKIPEGDLLVFSHDKTINKNDVEIKEGYYQMVFGIIEHEGHLVFDLKEMQDDIDRTVSGLTNKIQAIRETLGMSAFEPFFIDKIKSEFRPQKEADSPSPYRATIERKLDFKGAFGAVRKALFMPLSLLMIASIAIPGFTRSNLRDYPEWVILGLICLVIYGVFSFKNEVNKHRRIKSREQFDKAQKHLVKEAEKHLRLQKNQHQTLVRKLFKKLDNVVSEEQNRYKGKVSDQSSEKSFDKQSIQRRILLIDTLFKSDMLDMIDVNKLAPSK